MPYNQRHEITFTALLQLWGLPPELVKPISQQLANIDNNVQDDLIQQFTVALQKKQNPQ